MKKTALITGASSGIGLELANVFASKGTDLILVSRNICRLDILKKELEKKYNVTVHAMEKDLSVPDAATEVYGHMLENNIRVDYLVNNAGFGDFGFFAESRWNKQEQMINLNILALVHLTRLFLPGMIERGEGRIMNVASLASFQGGPLMAVYSATKAFVLSFSEALDNEVREKGITVTALCPGPTESGFKEAAAMENSAIFRFKFIPSSRAVAEYGYKAMLKGKKVAIHGLLNNILATSVKLVPRSVAVSAARKMQELS